MNGPDILARLRGELAQTVEGHTTPEQPEPLPISPWVAMSLLQKSLSARLRIRLWGIWGGLSRLKTAKIGTLEGFRMAFQTSFRRSDTILGQFSNGH
jgi:hypothetical protein